MSNDNNVPIFRFNFSEEFNKELGYFAKLHKHEDRIEFKENWKEWIEENEELINEEKKRLVNLGYEGDIEDKMYTSVRYYFRKKPLRTEPVKRGERERIVMSKKLLHQMDKHIKNNNFNGNYTPQIAYEDFCNEYQELITTTFEVEELNMEDNEFLQNKIKKTYKNRFYVIIRKTNNKQKNNEEKNNEETNIEETNNEESG
jgi:Fe-S cluster biosynthesis and repair protein YggX